jgi:hypothetical protein
MQVKISESYSLIQRNWGAMVVSEEKPDTIYHTALIEMFSLPVIDDNTLHKAILVLYE